MRALDLTGLAICAMLAASGAAATASANSTVPTVARKGVLEKSGEGYRWKLIQAPVPVAGDTQVLVHVRAVSLNRGDLDMLTPGSSRDYSGFVPATDAAGDVIAVGRGVTRVRVGERVTSTYFEGWVDGPASEQILHTGHGQSIDGVLGDYIVLDQTSVMPMLPWMSYEEAATLPTAGVTAWNALVSEKKPRAQDIVLVQGTGGVSVFAIQFAKQMGARVVVTSSSDDKLQKVRAFGAESGVNYKTSPKWAAKVMDVTGGHGADYIVNIGGKDTLAESTRSLAFGGSLALVGGLTGYNGEVSSHDLLWRTAQARGIYVGSLADYQRMLDFMSKHRVHPVIDRVFPVEQFEEALQYLEHGDSIGKVVLRF